MASNLSKRRFLNQINALKRSKFVIKWAQVKLTMLPDHNQSSLKMHFHKLRACIAIQASYTTKTIQLAALCNFFIQINDHVAVYRFLYFYGIARKHIILQKNKSQSMPCEIHVLSATMHVSVDLTFLFIHFMNETCPTWLHHCLGYVIYTHCTGGMCTQQILICHLRASAMPFIPIVLEKTLTLLLINDPS